MAEIKSTLELVLERTRHLTLTDEEKREHALSEFKADVNGLLQKYQDGVLNLERLEKEVRALQEKTQFTGNEIIMHEAVQRLSLEDENGPLLDLLTEICGVNARPIASVLKQYRDTMESEANERIVRTMAQLTKRGIKGSAVVPNLRADKEWTAQRMEIQERLGEKLAREAAMLKATARP